MGAHGLISVGTSEVGTLRLYGLYGMYLGQ